MIFQPYQKMYIFISKLWCSWRNVISKALKLYIVYLPAHPVPNKAIWTWKKQIKCEGCKMQPYTVDKIAPRDIVNS